MSLYIAFEGIDGCGKTTQLKLLRKYLQSKGYKVLTTKEPGSTSIGTKIREILLNPKNKNISRYAELMLYFADRAQHYEEVIKPNIYNADVILSDRCYLSTFAYQGFGNGISLDILEKLNKIVEKPELRINLIFLFDISPEKAKERIYIREDKLTRFDRKNEDFFKRVREGYLWLAKRDNRIKIINAEREITEIYREIVEEVEKWLI